MENSIVFDSKRGVLSMAKVDKVATKVKILEIFNALSYRIGVENQSNDVRAQKRTILSSVARMVDLGMEISVPSHESEEAIADEIYGCLRQVEVVIDHGSSEHGPAIIASLQSTLTFQIVGLFANLKTLGGS